MSISRRAAVRQSPPARSPRHWDYSRRPLRRKCLAPWQRLGQGRRTRRERPGGCWHVEVGGSRVRRTPNGGLSTARLRSTGSARPRTTPRFRSRRPAARQWCGRTLTGSPTADDHYRLVVEIPMERRCRRRHDRAGPAGRAAAAAACGVSVVRPADVRADRARHGLRDGRAAGLDRTVSCTGLLCQPFERKIVLGSGPTVFRDWQFAAPGLLTVVVGGRGVGRELDPAAPGQRPAVATQCGGDPVACLRGAPRCRAVPRAPVRRLVVSDVARGSRVQIVCRGDGCPRRDFSQFVVTSAEHPYVKLAPRGYRGLRPGATLRVFITRKQTYGLTVSFRVTRETVARGRIAVFPRACHCVRSPAPRRSG